MPAAAAPGAGARQRCRAGACGAAGPSPRPPRVPRRCMWHTKATYRATPADAAKAVNRCKKYFPGVIKERSIQGTNVCCCSCRRCLVSWLLLGCAAHSTWAKRALWFNPPCWPVVSVPPSQTTKLLKLPLLPLTI
jgi:hypothetical protein